MAALQSYLTYILGKSLTLVLDFARITVSSFSITKSMNWVTFALKGVGPDSSLDGHDGLCVSASSASSVIRARYSIIFSTAN